MHFTAIDYWTFSTRIDLALNNQQRLTCHLTKKKYITFLCSLILAAKSPRYDTKLRPVVRLQFWSLGEYIVTISLPFLFRNYLCLIGILDTVKLQTNDYRQTKMCNLYKKKRIWIGILNKIMVIIKHLQMNEI